MRIIAVDGSAAATDLLRRFYAEIYVSEFPDPNERESLENMLAYIQQREAGGYSPNNYHIIIALDGGDPVGCVVADYFAGPNAGVIEYIAVAPQTQPFCVARRLTPSALPADSAFLRCSQTHAFCAARTLTPSALLAHSRLLVMPRASKLCGGT
jgi:hypothetical protein